MSLSLSMLNLFESGIFKSEIILRRNEYLKNNDSIDTSIYYIKEGAVRVFIMDSEEERTVRFGYEQNIITSLDSFLLEDKSDFIIQAIKKTIVLKASKKDFYEFVRSSTDNLNMYHEILENLIVQQLEREKDLLTNSPKERYERVLRRSPQLFQLIPNKYIANYLRMTPETLSRLKKS